MKIFTIGFTRTSAESFFKRLTQAGVTKVVDVRLSNDSQLAGFAKKNDLKYFLDVICGIAYEHESSWPPRPSSWTDSRSAADRGASSRTASSG